MTRPLLVLVLLATLALSACGEKSEDSAGNTPERERLTLVLDYFPNADHAAIYAAKASGAFARAGLDVDIRAPGDATTPLKLLEAGQADLVISYEPELFLARDQGAKLVGIAALATKPLTSIIALGSAGIRSPADLKGKTVGTAGIPYQKAYLDTILKANGVDPASVKQVDVGFNLVPAMLTKKVDATLGAFWNYEGVQLAQEGKQPTIIRMDQAGVPTYDELVLVAREDALRDKSRGPVFRRFVQALQQGAQLVRRDPQAGIAPLLAANPDLEAPLQTAALQATIPVLFPSQPDRPYGWQDPDQWRAFGTWMQRNGLLKNAPNQGVLTNEFLAGEGVKPVDESAGNGKDEG